MFSYLAAINELPDEILAPVELYWYLQIDLERLMVDQLRFDVFVSYNSKDLQAVTEFAQRLGQEGIRAWLAGRELTPGELWQRTVPAIIRSIDCAVFCMGSRGVRGWQEIELHALTDQRVERDLRVIPVILPGTVGEPELPLFLKSVQIVDFRRTDPDPVGLLIKAISAQRRDPVSTVEVL